VNEPNRTTVAAVPTNGSEGNAGIQTRLVDNPKAARADLTASMLGVRSGRYLPVPTPEPGMPSGPTSMDLRNRAPAVEAR
jgi:hypothetical protein